MIETRFRVWCPDRDDAGRASVQEITAESVAPGILALPTGLMCGSCGGGVAVLRLDQDPEAHGVAETMPGYQRTVPGAAGGTPSETRPDPGQGGGSDGGSGRVQGQGSAAQRSSST